MNRCIAILLLLLKFATSSNNVPDDFTFDGYLKRDGTAELKLDGTAEISSNGLITLTNSSTQETGHVFYNLPIQFKNSLNASATSFSTTFVFAIVPLEYRTLSGHGLAFIISPNKEIPGALPSQYLGLFNDTNNGNSSNHIVAIEIDTITSREFNDINNNHIGIDINGLNSIDSAPAGYFEDQNGAFRNLSLRSGDSMQVWVEYDGINRQLNVTMSPINITKPKLPLLSLKKDLSPFLLEYMYVGFSSSTGWLPSTHYILGWSFKTNGQARQIDTSHLPNLPRDRQTQEGIDDNHDIQQERDGIQLNRILAIVLSPMVFLLLLPLIFGFIFNKRMKKFIEVLEDWEVQYGPQRFGYKDLFIATKGFKDTELLGRGGFGRVYRGVLPTSNIQVAVKRVAHDSRQELREFVAEIATIGLLRHPNLVRLLGYCRRKQELLLVYDYMPNGSLDRFLYGQLNGTLNWMQRFKIIKDVASSLFYLHQQWVQVIIHRDIKASNVLIDDEFNGRLGDFGLAKICDHGTDPQTSHVAGTLGYIAPELARSRKASTSTDLFAFGAFMLEVVCGRRPVEPQASPEKVILIDWVFECLERGNILEAIDRQLGTEYSGEQAELVLKLGLLCSHAIAAARPSMTTVVQYLEGRAQLTDNLVDIIKSRDFGGASNEEDVLPTTITSLTISEPFTSRESIEPPSAEWKSSSGIKDCSSLITIFRLDWGLRSNGTVCCTFALRSTSELCINRVVEMVSPKQYALYDLMHSWVSFEPNLHNHMPLHLNAKSAQRICFLSGLTGEEMMMFVDVFPDIGTGSSYWHSIYHLSRIRTAVFWCSQNLLDKIFRPHLSAH